MAAPPSPPDSSPTNNAHTAILALALALWVAFVFAGGWAVSRVKALPGVTLPVSRPAPARFQPRAPAPPPLPVVEETGPSWNSLTSAQQTALAPLQPHWSTLSEAQKQQWMALAQRFPKFSHANQEKLQTRMAAWAALSPEQRNRARLNFAATRKVAPPARQEQWDAYQALSEEARHELAVQAPPAPQGAAIAVRPVPGHRFAKVPAATGPAAAAPNPPKILPPVVDMVPVPVPARASTAPAPEPAPPVSAPLVETTPVETPSAKGEPLPSLDENVAPTGPAPAPESAAPDLAATPGTEATPAESAAPAQPAQ